MQLRRSPFSCLCLPLFCLCSCSCFCCCCCCCFGLIVMERKKEASSAGWVVARRKKAEMSQEKERNSREKKEKRSPGEEEGKGASRAPHVASPLIGKISLLTPVVFMTSKFFFTKIFNHNLIFTPLIKYLQYKLFTKYFTQIKMSLS